MFRLVHMLPLLALVGCAGSVQLEELDPFGAAWSAVWLRYDDSDFDTIVVTNTFDACTKYEDYAVALKDYQDEIEDMDPDDFCADAQDVTLNLAEASNKLVYEGAKVLSISVIDGDSSEPEENTYEVGDADALLLGGVTYYNDSPGEVILSDWDEDGDYEDGCGIDADDVEGDSDSWGLAEGEVEITAVNDEQSVTGALEGELEDEDGDSEGEIVANFTATYCELDL